MTDDIDMERQFKSIAREKYFGHCDQIYIAKKEYRDRLNMIIDLWQI